MKRKFRMRLTLLTLLLFTLTFIEAEPAPESPSVLPGSILRLIADEVNGYAAYNTVALISTYHRNLGSDQTAEVLARLKKKCEGYGLKETGLIRVPVRTGYEFFGLQNFDGQVPTRERRAELRLIKPFPKLISTTESAPSCLIQGSRRADVTSPLVYIGTGDDPKNYEGKEVRGKIVLAGNAMPDDVKEMAIHRYGAAGVLFYFDLPHNSGDNDDAVLGMYWSPWGKDGGESTFGISLSNNQYRFLKDLLDRREEVIVRVNIDAEIKTGEEAVFETLEAAIPGSEYPDEEFLIWAHIDHPLPGATDNASGCGVIMEIARTLQALIENGYLPSPKRTIRFLWLPHVTGLYMYLTQHPEKIGKIRGGLSVDNVGISQSLFSNYFASCKPSHSLPSYWSAVLENLTEHLADRTNRNFLDWRNLDNLYAPEGSRDQFNVRLIPYNGSGDEMQTNNNTVRIPTIALGSAPVPPRHSQVNFLSYIDPTGLHRVAYLGAALAAVFGWTDENNVALLIDEVYLRGRSKLVEESNMALASLALAGKDEILRFHQKGRLLIKYGLEREISMLDSVRPLLPENREVIRTVELRAGQQKALVSFLLGRLDEEYQRRCIELGCRPSKATLSKEELGLSGLIPKPVPGVMGTSAYFGNYYEKVLGKERLASFGLKPDFSYGHVGYTEAHNFIDGQRSILEIFEATAAELWSEGYPAAHEMTLQEVANYMRMLEAAGAITISSR